MERSRSTFCTNWPDVTVTPYCQSVPFTLDGPSRGSFVHDTHQQLERYYVEKRGRLLAFIQGKVGDDALAEDILQDSLLKALRSSPDLEDSERLVSWLYRIIRNAVTDAYRRRGAAQRKLDTFALASDDAEVPPEDEAALCACFEDLLPTLKPEYSELIEAMELGDVTTEEMTTRLGSRRTT
ncbi:MAG: RNA polymerase sigma factor [Gemmatimonadota bacterium]